MNGWKFDMGEELKDKISGFKGVVVGRSEYITGCNRYVLQPKCEKNKMAELPEPVELDETTLERTKAKKKPLEKTMTGPLPTRGKKW